MENKLIKFVEESIWELKMVARLFAGKKENIAYKKRHQNLRSLLNLFAKKFYGCKALVKFFLQGLKLTAKRLGLFARPLTASTNVLVANR